MATRIIAYTAALALALSLAACESVDTSTQQAWQACAGVEPWQVHSQCLRNQYARQDAQQQINENNAAILLMGGTAFMNGWNAGRDAPLPMTNYGGRTTIWSGQSGMLQGY